LDGGACFSQDVVNTFQGCQIGFFDPKFRKMRLFLKAVGVKKLFGVDSVFFSMFGSFWRQLTDAIRLVSSLFKYIAEKCY